MTATTLGTIAPAPPPVPDQLDALLRRMRLPYLRKAAPDVLATARAQRWDPAEVIRILLEEEVRGRDEAGRRIRRKAAGLPAWKTFASWREADSSIPLPAQHALMTLEWVTRAENLAVAALRHREIALRRGPRAQGHRHRDAVAWFTLETLTASLGRAAVDGTTARAITKITRCDLIVIDDIGMLPAGRPPARPSTGSSTPPTSVVGHRHLEPAPQRIRHHHAQDPGHRDRRPAPAPRPPVTTEGTSLRLAEATTGKGVIPHLTSPPGDQLTASTDITCPPARRSAVRPQGSPDVLVGGAWGRSGPVRSG